MIIRSFLLRNQKVAIVILAGPRAGIHTSPVVAEGGLHHNYLVQMPGKREIVGWGVNGVPYYVDRPDFPYPAIRWQEDSPEILKLREKEKGDWHLITLEEAKKLYRASYCATFAELFAPTGNWKFILAVFLLMNSIGMVMFGLVHIYALSPLPYTFSEEWREMELRYMIDTHSEPITGIASKWDYEKERWKA